MKTLWTNRTRRAVTLTELLVVLAIVSLLATLAVPVYVQQTERARKAIARAEVRAIADAQQMCAITHGFYIPINMLDNIPNDISDTDIRDDFDNHPALGDAPIIDIGVRVVDQQGSQNTFADAGTVPAVENMIEQWQGPFLNPVRVADWSGTPPNTSQPLTQEEVSRDTVLDPWGRPYVLFTSLGIANSAADADEGVNFSQYDLNDRRLADQITISTNFDQYDRFAIVSYGPDGYLNDENPLNANAPFDDIVYQFGSDPNPLTVP